MSEAATEGNLPAGTVARIKVEDGPLTSWPYAEKLPRGRGWQSGAIHYPESQVASMEAIFERSGPELTATKVERDRYKSRSIEAEQRCANLAAAMEGAERALDAGDPDRAARILAEVDL
jgi:hypothetical protein